MDWLPDTPCDDCVKGFCTMNCSTPGRFVDLNGWRSASGEPAPTNGDHILVCSGRFERASWTFNQAPPKVVHYFPDETAPGFYLSSGIVEGSYNDEPVTFDWWKPLVGTEPQT